MKRSHSAFVQEAKRICVDHIQGTKRSFDVAFDNFDNNHHETMSCTEDANSAVSYRAAKRAVKESAANHCCSGRTPYQRNPADRQSVEPDKNTHPQHADAFQFSSGISTSEYARIFREGYAAGCRNSQKHAHEHFSSIEQQLPRLIREHYESHLVHLAHLFDAELKSAITQMMQSGTSYSWVH